MFLGIDAGGTHTDAAVVERGRIVASAKVVTRHDDLPASIGAVLRALHGVDLSRVSRVTLGTTLAVNAVVQGKADAVGLLLSAGPGLAPERAALGDCVAVVPGGLDHRGHEVTPLDVTGVPGIVRSWRQAGVRAFAVAGKFSPRNPAHEAGMADAVRAVLPNAAVTQGRLLSGALNFPRRVATAYYSAAVSRLHGEFLDAVEAALHAAGIAAPVRLLKADGGAAPLSLSRREPAQSIMSGPAASVMGLLALCPAVAAQDSLLLDVGGTTTDIALYAEGSPVLDRDGMRLNGRSTLVRSLATLSIGVGGDSLLRREGGAVVTGPLRQGPAAAFGGTAATLLDALNVLGPRTAGDAAASRTALEALAGAWGMTADALAQAGVESAVSQIAAAVRELVARVNAAPVYTLAALLEDRQVRPAHAWLVGGPAGLLRGRLADALGMPVTVPPHAEVANAVGAALTLPTASLELFADTGEGLMRIPACDIARRVPRSYGLEQAREDAEAALLDMLRAEGVDGLPVETVEENLFPTLDDSGRGSRDIRVVCQLSPGIAGVIAPQA
ncbi:MAG: hydantoinase/oxoprolinase family protein [Desulfovibrionaceae bacterium]|nr:hydantoinase/oxoprolinase family protein [Desulfovibrionaceae bacterium]